MSTDSKRVLVTGGAGFIGSHLIESFLNSGHEVIVFDDFSYGSAENLYSVKDHQALKVVQGDIRDLTSLQSAAEDVDE